MSNNIDFPAETTAGLNFSASVDAFDNQAPAWTVSAVLRGPGQINLTATGSGATHTFSASAAVTGAWTPGLYAYSIRATNGADVFELFGGQMTVQPDLASVTTPHDARSDNEKALEAINAVLANRATLDQDRYRINNRELWRTPVSELLRLQAFYKTRVRRERLAAKGASTMGRNIPVRFS